MLVHLTTDQKVGGSNPSGRAKLLEAVTVRCPFSVNSCHPAGSVLVAARAGFDEGIEAREQSKSFAPEPVTVAHGNRTRH